MNYTKNDLKQLNQLFIYWHLVKQIILETNYEQNEHEQIAEFCRHSYFDNENELKIIDEFEKTYHDHSPIWWYTRECFIYVMLNRALQTQDIEVIVKMGSFIQDLHKQLQQLQKKPTKNLLLYRSQNAFIDDFEKMKSSQGNLLSFNNFLLANSDYESSLEEAKRAKSNSNCLGILFCIETIFTSTISPFTSLKNISFYQQQDKFFLFSIHSIFRINLTIYQ